MMQRDTIVALATPHGESAISVVRASGQLCEHLFREISSRQEFLPKTLYLCQYCSLSGKIIDDILITYFRCPNSYTGEDSIEFYCHGNMLIVKKILEDLMIRGCRLAEPGEFTKRAFLNQKFDLCQAEAVADIIHASNERAMAVAQKQLSGALSEKIGNINHSLMIILSKIEKEINFSEDDISPSEDFHEKINSEIDTVLIDVVKLIDSHKVRSILDNGIPTVILGEPNAGKSSLFNFLLECDRAIVSAAAGTTRDVISEKIPIGGHIVTICDTAGIRIESDDIDGIEKIGIERAISTAEKAELFLIVIDSNSETLPIFPQRISKKFSKKNSLIIINKIDLQPRCHFENFFPNLDRIEISLKTENSSARLKNKIQELLSKNIGISNDIDVSVNARHSEILHDVKTHLEQSKESILCNRGIEIAACDIRNSLEDLGKIVGKYDIEKTLDLVFSHFCIGK